MRVTPQRNTIDEIFSIANYSQRKNNASLTLLERACNLRTFEIMTRPHSPTHLNRGMWSAPNLNRSYTFPAKPDQRIGLGTPSLRNH